MKMSVSANVSQILSFLPHQDYEYSSYNPIAFDIANHFCEMAADYHTETPHVLDYAKYPSAQLFYHVVLIVPLPPCFLSTSGNSNALL